MSGPLIPQVRVAEVRAEHARQNAIQAQFRREQAGRYRERIRQIAIRMRARFTRANGAEARP